MNIQETILGDNFTFQRSKDLLVQFSSSVVSYSLGHHGPQYSRLPCPSPTPRAYSNSCPLSWWCHPTILSSAVPFSCFQSFPTSGSFPMSQFFAFSSSLVTQSCPTLCNPMNCSTPGLPVHHQLPESIQTHVHWVSDAVQPSHPLSSPFLSVPYLSPHQSRFQWVNSSHEVAKVLEFQL